MQTNPQASLNCIKMEPPGGAVPLSSPFYIERAADRLFHAGLLAGDPLLLLKGSRQAGKTSLLARGLQAARERGWKIVLTDFQKFNTSVLQDPPLFYQTLCYLFSDQLDVTPPPEGEDHRSPEIHFENYLVRTVLPAVSTRIIWAMDEVDRMFSSSVATEFFALLRSMQNERAAAPHSPSNRLTMAIAYATEAHLFITDINLSPFNLGTRLTLEPFTLAEVGELNRRYGSPLRSTAELETFYRWVGGQPFLVRRSLHELATSGANLGDLRKHASDDEGIFSDHLRRLLVLLRKDRKLFDIFRNLLRGEPFSHRESFQRLRKVGLLKGLTMQEAQVSCGIYHDYFKRHLG